jgi:hypothetical protein
MFNELEVSKGAWFVFFILSSIPGVNLIFWIVLLVGQDTNRSLKNLLVVQMIMAAVGVVLYFAVFAAMFAAMAGSV